MSEDSAKDLDAIIKRLKERTPPAEIGYMPQALHKDSVPPTALALPFVDARFVQQTLDDACGPLGWQSKVENVGGFLVVGIGIRNPQTEEWVWKWDTGQEEPSDIADSEDASDHSAGAKGVISRGFKRAGVQWGIGRDIYDLPKRRRPIKLFGGKFAGWDSDRPLTGTEGPKGPEGPKAPGTPAPAEPEGGTGSVVEPVVNGSGKAGVTPEYTRFRAIATRLKLSQLDINQLLQGQRRAGKPVDYRLAGDQLLTQLPEDERGKYALPDGAA